MNIARQPGPAAATLIAVLLLILTAWTTPPAAAADVDEITKASFFNPGLAPVRRTGRFDVTVVYFMDYQCPACRKHTPDVARALNEDRRVRVIYRDTPIFGPRSEAAARAAIASHFQGRHEAMHLALMNSKMPLDEAALKAAAEQAGVDWDRLQRDLDERRHEIDAQIDRNMELSRFAGIAGTPAFIVGDYLANGVLDYEGLKGTIADARADARTAAPKADDAPSKPAIEATAEAQPLTDQKPHADAAAETAPPVAGAFADRAVRKTGLKAANDERPSSTDSIGWAAFWILVVLAFAAAALVARRRLT